MQCAYQLPAISELPRDGTPCGSHLTPLEHPALRYLYNVLADVDLLPYLRHILFDLVLYVCTSMCGDFFRCSEVFALGSVRADDLFPITWC